MKNRCIIGFNPKRLVLVMWLLVPVMLWSQRKIEGHVVDNLGEPLAGVTVAVKGTTVGTSTNVDGYYSLEIPSSARTLSVSMIGMETVELTIRNEKSVYNAELKEEAILMDELVVVGYGTMKKKDLTGSVASVTGKALSNIPLSNTESALTGRMAGVRVTTSDGAPDAEIQIRVRGGGSITQDNNPLYIVDGFPVDRISDIAVADIESIDVLKDASSTAIYGARGANGVIIVTTKSAKGGKTTVSYNAYAQVKTIPHMYDVLDPYEFVTLQYELNYIKYQGDVASFTTMFGDVDDFDIYKNIEGRDSQLEMYGREAFAHSHNVSITGGTDKTKFNASFTYLDENGILLNSSMTRYNANFKLNHQLSSKLRFDLSAYYTNSTVYGAGTSGSSSTQIKNAVCYRPVIGKDSYVGNDILTNSDMYDDIEAQSELYDPILLINQDYKRRNTEDLNVNMALTYEIFKFLKYKGEFGLLSNGRETKRFYGPITTTGRTNSGLPVAEITTESKPRWRTAHTLDFKMKLKEHNIGALLGFEAMSEKESSLQSTSRMFPVDILPDDAFARMQFGSAEYTETYDEPDTRLASFFGRVNYSYADKYLITATLRADGSTKFAPGNRWGLFPSVAGAWRMSNEGFMSSANWLDDLKIRLSYGAAGNNRIDSDMWRRTYKGTIDKPVVGIGNVPNLYYTQSSTTLVNEDLRWETTITRDAGLDFALFKSRLTGTLDAYWNTTRDLLLKSIIPEHTGYSEQQKNIGQTSNRGIELTLNSVIVQRNDFSLSMGFNISMNRNRVDKLIDDNTVFYRSGWAEGLRESDDYILKVGEPIGLIYGYVTDGFYTVDDYIIEDGVWTLKPGVANSQGITDSHWTVNMASGMPNPGSLKLKKTTPYDPNDPESCKITADDRQVIGNTNPKHTGGFNINANYKNLDLSLFFNWSYGNDVYNANKILFTTQWKKNYYNMLTLVDSEHRFRHMNDQFELVTDPDELRALNQNATIWSPAMKVPVLHSWAIEDGSFLRLNNVVLGYSLPKKVISKLRMSQFRIYATVNNVFVLTKYTGFDPEVNTRTETPLTPGVDYSSYPKARSFTIGTNISF